MNPSAPGWIKKHLTYLLNHLSCHPMSERKMYKRLRKNGFIYGTSVSTLSDEESELLKWTEEERTKINLFDALVFTFYNSTSTATTQECVNTILDFYAKLDSEFKKGGFQLLKESDFYRLEKVIDQRIKTNEPLLKKNFSHLITNVLLYIDVLAFNHYLVHKENPRIYAKHIEAVVTQMVWVALLPEEQTDSRKQKKDTYNDLLIKLFESSIRYNNWPIENIENLTQVISSISKPLEKSYLLDICALAIGSDQDIDRSEIQFINKICKQLNISSKERNSALKTIINFITQHQDQISYLKYSNSIQHFYNQTSKTVSTLVLRNKKRLTQEIKKSKELAILLSQSAIRDLSKEEKKIVRNQLLDICKSVPSLAIFLLPGGAILMPLLVKFIPQLLPSAFNENKEI